ncbi:unnamed protein product [Tuber melanosporum]|uniref:(Perigord truffle) hypothetical protein n=1 Tax=Tuber melanosporum (strain Mel28) TaxID=656061 RepID=D5GNA1_TUBMM|nr:uncharacterized protein GSTUM_00011190001 [Tuber melanosporum]CAZ85994.1 unnamed protein product [Tuber melanosporum]
MGISQVYDKGQVFAPSVLDIDDEQLLASFLNAVKTLATISLAVNYPTLPSVIHSLVNSYKKAIAVALETEYSWEAIDELKDRIANPEAYASAGPAPGATAAEDSKPEAKEEEKEDEESEDEGGFGDLFG